MTFKSILLRVANVLKKGLVRDTLWLLFAQGFGIVLQLAGFTLIARALGVEAYGTFIGITSFASIAVPFVGLGSGDILIKHVSRSPDSPFQPLFREYWGRALLTTSISGIGLTGLSLLVVNAILPGKAAPLMIGLILLADLLFLKLWDVATKAFLAIDRVSLTARIKLFLNFNKLLAAVILFVFFRDPGLEAWAILYFASTALTGVISVLLVNQIVAPPTWRSPRLNSELLQGLYFSISASADNINASIDKTMLASLSTATAAGLYAAAYRCIDVGSVGLLALSGAAYAKFFQQGKSGIQGSLRFAKRLLPLVSAYGIAACTVFFLLAPVIPYVLGAEYVDSINAVRWLSPVPLLLSIQYLAADTLTGAGFQGIRSFIQVAAALLNILLNFLLIPDFAWKGSAWATLMSESFKLISLWAAVGFFYFKPMGDRNS